MFLAPLIFKIGLTSTIVTMTKMMGTLPETVQNRALEHLRAYIAEIGDEQAENG